MTKKSALVCLALSAVALAGCGGGGGSSAPSAAAPSASAPSSSAPVETPGTSTTPSAAASASTGSGAAKVSDPCKVLDAAKVSDLTGVEVKKGTAQDVGGSTVCTWLPKDGTKASAAVISAQEGPLPGSLSQVEGQLKEQFDGKVSRLEVDGADDARYVTGTKSGLNVIDVLAQRGDVFYQVIVATPRDAESHKAGAVKVAEALLSA